MAYRNKHPKYGIYRTDDLFAPYTEEAQSVGARGGYLPIMRFWGHAYPTWEAAKVALQGGPDGFPGPTAVPVDPKTGKRLPEPSGLKGGLT
jgi:hypothetical protein